MRNYRVIGVSKIVNILFYEQVRQFYVSKNDLHTGYFYHQRLGFDQQDISIAFFYKDKQGNIWLIRGKPDRLYIEDGRLIVSELKVYRSDNSRDLLAIMGWTQANLYAYGLTRGQNLETIVEAYLFNPKKGELELAIRIPADFNYAEYTLDKAIEKILYEERLKREMINRGRTLANKGKTLEEYL